MRKMVYCLIVMSFMSMCMPKSSFGGTVPLSLSAYKGYFSLSAQANAFSDSGDKSIDRDGVTSASVSASASDSFDDPDYPQSFESNLKVTGGLQKGTRSDDVWIKSYIKNEYTIVGLGFSDASSSWMIDAGTVLTIGSNTAYPKGASGLNLNVDLHMNGHFNMHDNIVTVSITSDNPANPIDYSWSLDPDVSDHPIIKVLAGQKLDISTFMNGEETFDTEGSYAPIGSLDMTFSVDNKLHTPEPATLGLLTLGALSLRRRRR